MPIEFTSLQSIKSVSQRALASYWDRLAAGRRFSAFTEFKPEHSMHNPKQLVAWNIEGEGRHLKFRAVYQGENVAEVFSSAWAGKTMDQVVPMSLRRLTMEAAHECEASGCVVYTVISTIDTNERRVDCERLLLPFGRDGSKVEQILASLPLTSIQGIQGGAGRKKILNNFQIQADQLFAGKIKSSIDGHEIGAGKHEQADTAVNKNRRASRRNILRAGRIRFAKESMTCTVRNISATGALLEGASSIGWPRAKSTCCGLPVPWPICPGLTLRRAMAA
jgi:hypothetical protein